MHSFVQFQSFEISLVVYHLQKNSGNSGPFVNGTRLFNSFRWKISGKKGIYEKVVPISRWKFSQWKISKWNTNFHFSHQFQALHGCFRCQTPSVFLRQSKWRALRCTSVQCAIF